MTQTPFKVEIDKDYFFNSVNLKGCTFLVNGVSDSIDEVKSYKGVLLNGSDNSDIIIPASNCTIVYELETDPTKIKELDDWFDNVTDEYIASPEAEPVTFKELTLKLIHWGTIKKSISFPIEGLDVITPDDVINQYDKLNEFIEKKEDSLKYLGGSSPKIYFSSNTISLSFDEESYSTVRTKYWKWTLDLFKQKEEKPKYEKLRSVLRYGISRLPQYNDMFFIEINAKKEIVEEFYNGDVNKLKIDLEKEGFKCNIINIDYVIEDNQIFETNKLI